MSSAEEVIRSLDGRRDQAEDINIQRASLPFYTFMSLDKASEGFRETISRDMFNLKASKEYNKLHRYGRPEPCPQLLGFVQNQVSKLVPFVSGLY